MSEPRPTTTDPAEVWELTGSHGAVTLSRDAYGIPAITAPSTAAAWWGLGYAAAQDRLWQLEYDRRRACGRWGEVAGRAGLAADRLARRLRLEDAARADIAAMQPETLAAFAAYAEGVNAGAASRPLPPEYSRAGIDFEPWEPWHSVAAFKIRHVLMGVWQFKLLRARILADEGVEAFRTLDPVPREGMRFTTPSGARQAGELAADAELWRASWGELAAAASELGFLSEVEAGSNAWAVAGSRTETGMPVLCNDPHRAADVPNVYWQARLECPEFVVTGATFPGIPGFPHFGHNGRVGWAITNAAADAQDLLVERFRRGEAGLEVLTSTGWQAASTRRERIRLRDPASGAEESVELVSVATPNGPVVHGDPESGRALSLRWTATERPCTQFDVLDRMLRADTVEEFIAAHEGWVDPINNLLSADAAGNIGYLLRGALPARRDPAAAELPVPGWLESSGWDGRVPFARMPRELNPANGYLANANNTVVDPAGSVLVTHAANDFYRIERIDELLESKEHHSLAELHAYQNDTSSVAARLWAGYLAGLAQGEGDVELGRATLAAWSGALGESGPAPVIYAHFRRELVRLALPRIVSSATAERLIAAELPASGVLIKRWIAQVAWEIRLSGAPLAPVDEGLVREALALSVAAARAVCGPELSAWDWRALHPLRPRHTVPAFGLADPRPACAGGDSDTVQNAAYGWRSGTPFTVTNTAVYRQILDFSGEGRGGWVIPGGGSGNPLGAHYDDQLEFWEKGELLPMPTPTIEKGNP
ncbi:MAG TPA: penicillin acylase family protein [Gryllotalpicola sp.]